MVDYGIERVAISLARAREKFMEEWTWDGKVSFGEDEDDLMEGG